MELEEVKVAIAKRRIVATAETAEIAVTEEAGGGIVVRMVEVEARTGEVVMVDLDRDLV